MGKETPDEAAASWTGPTADKFEKCAVPPHLLRDHGTDSTLDSKQYSQYFDPCQEAAQKSIRCLHRNGGDREMCSDFFQYEALCDNTSYSQTSLRACKMLGYSRNVFRSLHFSH
jgi:cytochrome c oxidase assembly protein subunit 23